MDSGYYFEQCGIEHYSEPIFLNKIIVVVQICVILWHLKLLSHILSIYYKADEKQEVLFCFLKPEVQRNYLYMASKRQDCKCSLNILILRGKHKKKKYS